MMAKGQYKITLKIGGQFIGLVIAAVIHVILLFGFIYGFDTLFREVRGGAQAMTAAMTQPLTPMCPQPGQMFMQHGMRLGPAAFAANPYAMRAYPQGGRMPACGQYLCPQHGAVGIPGTDASGLPRCPMCGQCMWLNGGITGGNPAARPRFP